MSFKIQFNYSFKTLHLFSFEKIGNGEAARILQEEATKGGQIRLVVGKMINSESIQ